jgi:hypothetical protein
LRSAGRPKNKKEDILRMQMRDMKKDSSTQPVFVVGIWRSGTSLLYALLNQNPKLSLMYEGDLLLLGPMFWGGRSKADWKQRWDFWNAGLSRHHLDTRRIPDHPANLAAAMESVGREYAGAAIWGCKSPSYYDRLDQLSRLFPGARFIIIWRDPADTLRSIVRASQGSSWFGKTGMSVRALLGDLEMKKGCDLLVARECRLHQLHYEELVRDPASIMAGVCKFLEIPYDPRMGTLEGADRSAIFSASHHAMVKGERIVSGSTRTEVLAPRLKKKIDRYVVYWKKRYGGSWPGYPLVPEGSAEATLLERTLDSLAFAICRAWDRSVALVYCFAPVFLLAAYRRVKSRWQQDFTESAEFSPLREDRGQSNSRSLDDTTTVTPFSQVVEVGETREESRT